MITASLAGSLAASQALRFGSAENATSRRIFADSIKGTSTSSELPRRGDCPVCSQITAPVSIIPCANSLASELHPLEAGNPIEVILPEPLILSLQCKSCGVGQGQDAPLLWRAADHDASLANCAACGAEGAVDIQIRDKISAEAFGSKASLPLPFVMATSDWGTQVFVFCKGDR